MDLKKTHILVFLFGVFFSSHVGAKDFLQDELRTQIKNQIKVQANNSPCSDISENSLIEMAENLDHDFCSNNKLSSIKSNCMQAEIILRTIHEEGLNLDLQNAVNKLKDAWEKVQAAKDSVENGEPHNAMAPAHDEYDSVKEELAQVLKNSLLVEFYKHTGSIDSIENILLGNTHRFNK